MGDRSSVGEDVFAERLLRTLVTLPTQDLRVAYLRAELTKTTPSAALQALEYIFLKARGASRAGRDAIVAVAGLVSDTESAPLIESLRTCLSEHHAPALRRALHGAKPVQRAESRSDEDERRVPDYGKGRPLTLGERKSLARAPTRALFDKLLVDPHPAVIRNLLANPLTTEDDIVRLAARRPNVGEVLAEIMCHPKWNVRRRVRVAVVLNPSTPDEVGVPLVELLSRGELRTVVEGSDTNPAIRQAARDRMRELGRPGRTYRDLN